MRTLLIATGVLVGSCVAATAQPAGLKTQVDAWVAEHQAPIIAELTNLLAVPNVAADRENIRRNATMLAGMLDRRGLRSELLETSGNPLVFGALDVPGATRTLLFYAHYDGQPTNPAGWTQAAPWTPVLRTGRSEDGGADRPTPPNGRYDPDWRLYARSSSDDKSPIVALLAAIDALKAGNTTMTSNIRVILDGEEEAGSPSLVPAISRHRDKLRADAMIILDGPVHPSEKPTLVFGARGIVTLSSDRVRPEDGPAQRPLRQLGAESRDAPGAAARDVQGRSRARHR